MPYAPPPFLFSMELSTALLHTAMHTRRHARARCVIDRAVSVRVHLPHPTILGLSSRLSDL